MYLRKDSIGQLVYFPWGSFGGGFVVDSEERRSSILRALDKLDLGIPFLFVTIIPSVSIWLKVMYVTLYLIVRYFCIRKLTNGLARATMKARSSLPENDDLAGLPLGVQVGALILWLSLFLFYIFAIYVNERPRNLLFYLCCLVFFAVAAMGIRSLVVKIKRK
jgi:hypothetical protein